MELRSEEAKTGIARPNEMLKTPGVSPRGKRHNPRGGNQDKWVFTWKRPDDPEHEKP